jgi:hypothetical protein
MSKGVWVRSHIKVNEGETLFYFHPDDGGCQSWVVLSEDGTVEFKGNREIAIRNVGTDDEDVVVKNAADLVI